MNHRIAVLRSFLLLLGALCLVVAAGCASTAPHPFDDRAEIDAFIAEMVQKYQFDERELKQVFARVQLRPAIIAAMERPAEAKPWYQYRPIFVNNARIREGVAFWDANSDALQRAQTIYGVPPEIIVAIIGVETRYGRYKGGFPVIDALSTLAFAYPPRSKFFRSELEQYLLMTREEHIDPLSMKGSYAGAMGQPQFIASSFRNYAVDFDGDGHRDLWNSATAAIGSVGNYFKQHGWLPGQPVATRAQVEGSGYQTLLAGGLKPQWSITELDQAGVTVDPPTPGEIRGALFALETEHGPEYWVGWQNFYAITRYNRSPLYAMAVYQLGEAILAAKHAQVLD